jgi:Staphylococcal nuclease homologue
MRAGHGWTLVRFTLWEAFALLSACRPGKLATMSKIFPAIILWILSPIPAFAFPPCAPPVEIRDLPIMRVEQGGLLVATDGQAIKLEGILLPGGARDHAPQYLADQALDALHGLAVRHLITATAEPPKEDRYGRLRAQVFVTDDSDRWIQEALLRQGLARVSISADRHECAKELYAAEADARMRHAGIWTLPAYAVRHADNVQQSDLGTFQIVQGTVTSAAVRSGRAYINFGEDWKTDFTATIAPEDLKAFRDVDIDPQSYTGKTIRVRGVIEWHDGPEIELATPDDIEIVPDIRPAER